MLHIFAVAYLQTSRTIPPIQLRVPTTINTAYYVLLRYVIMFSFNDQLHCWCPRVVHWSPSGDFESKLPPTLVVVARKAFIIRCWSRQTTQQKQQSAIGLTATGLPALSSPKFCRRVCKRFLRLAALSEGVYEKTFANEPHFAHSCEPSIY